MSYTNRNYIFAEQLYNISSNMSSNNTKKIIIFDDNNNKKQIDEIIHKGKLLDIEFIHENSIQYLTNFISNLEDENCTISDIINGIANEILKIIDLRDNDINLQDNYIKNIDIDMINNKVLNKINSRLIILPKNINPSIDLFKKQINVNLDNDFCLQVNKEYKQVVIKFINLINKQYQQICLLNKLAYEYNNIISKKFIEDKYIIDRNRIKNYILNILESLINCFVYNLTFLIIFLDIDNTINITNSKFIIDCIFKMIEDIKNGQKINKKFYKNLIKTLSNINNVSEEQLIIVNNNNCILNYKPLEKSLKYL